MRHWKSILSILSVTGLGFLASPAHAGSAEASDLEATFLEITREQPPSEGGDGRHPAAGRSDRAVREDVER